MPTTLGACQISFALSLAAPQPPVASAVSAVLAGAELLLLAPLVLEALEGSDVFFLVGYGRLYVYPILRVYVYIYI